MPKSPPNLYLMFALAAACLFGIGIYFYYQSPIPEETTVVLQAKEKVKVKKPRVKLNVFVTTCQKLTVTIPLDAGFITQTDDLRVLKGYVSNDGDLPVQYVQVQLLWQNKMGEFIDYDDIFAVSSEVLQPGNRAEFQMSKRNILIEKCSAKLLDWWVVDGTEK